MFAKSRIIASDDIAFEASPGAFALATIHVACHAIRISRNSIQLWIPTRCNCDGNDYSVRCRRFGRDRALSIGDAKCRARPGTIRCAGCRTDKYRARTDRGTRGDVCACARSRPDDLYGCTDADLSSASICRATLGVAHFDARGQRRCGRRTSDSVCRRSNAQIICDCGDSNACTTRGNYKHTCHT